MKKITLNNWAVVTTAGPYTPPEAITSRLQGKVINHPRFKDDYPVITSPIKEVKGRIVTTRSGSNYHLGTVDPEYAKLYPETDLEGEQPIKMKDMSRR